MIAENLKKIYVFILGVEMCTMRMLSVYEKRKPVTNFRVTVLS